jgi:2-oxoisovalerate dehydrogenase E1 component alpha subunit
MGYGVRTIRVDGNDVLAVYAATKTARAIALEHNCPVLIEAMTYRLSAHSTSDDPSGYRSKDEEEQWQLKDPVLRFHKWLDAKGWLDTKALDKYKESMRAEILDALKKAEVVPISPLRDIVEDVYDTPPWHLQKQLKELEAHVAKYPQDYPKTAGRK